MCTKTNKVPLGETYVDLAIYLIHKLHVSRAWGEISVKTRNAFFHVYVMRADHRAKQMT